jgi:polyvinyl alcohol dehydrogenase (cytochrome)
VVGGTVYVPDWGGTLWAVDAATGREKWSRPVSAYTGVTADVSRLSPAYWHGMLVSGDGATTRPSTAGAIAYAVDAATGQPLWRTTVDNDPAAILTGSPVVADGVAYVGVSSKAELRPAVPTFRGSVVALDAATGRLLWKTWMVPAGYTGGAVWGSAPVVDTARGLLYVGVGNNYTVPPGVCATPVQILCRPQSPDNHIDSVLALRLADGSIAWSRPTRTADTWTLFTDLGPDFDFGAAPNLFTTTVDGRPTELLGIGQKSGTYWALDPLTGTVIWQTHAGPGGTYGGIEWGTAADGRRIYLAIANSGHVPTVIRSASGHTSVTTGGFWAALDAGTGRILWQTADPHGALAFNFVSAAADVVYVGSLAAHGDNMLALDAATGEFRWRFASGGAVLGGAAVVDGTVYWGSGYHTLAIGLPYDGDNDKLFAFSLPDGG